METNKTFGIEFLTALAGFQNDTPTIPKMKKGYGYNYAELSKTIELIKPNLKKYELGFTQLLEGKNNLRTIIFHFPTAQFIEVVTELPTGYELKGMNLYQTDGARNTYYKRYVLFGLLGIFSEDEDTDAKGQIKQAPAPTVPAKPKLNNNQFIQLLGAVNAQQITVQEALESYDLTNDQKKSFENL